MESLSRYKSSPRNRGWYVSGRGPFPAPAATRKAPETLSVERAEALRNLDAPVIEPYSPAVCFAIIVAIGVTLWAIIAAAVLAILW